MTDHCIACQIARILLHHRDQVAPTWDQRRVTLNFARIVAERACPEYVAASENPALNKGNLVESGAVSDPASAQTDRGLGLANKEPIVSIVAPSAPTVSIPGETI